MVYVISILGNFLVNEFVFVDILEDKFKGGMLN